MTTSTTAGIHHITAMCGDPQRNVDFYAGVLGLRLVKRTVNFDDPQTYHLYFGNGTGSPGSLMTFFPWGAAPRGRVGPGQIAITALAVAQHALGFWIQRLLRYGIAYSGPTTRRNGTTDEQVLAFQDGDGLLLELVATPQASGTPGWHGAQNIPAESAIRGIHGVTMWERDGAPTSAFLTALLGLQPAGDEGPTHDMAVVARTSGTSVRVRTTGDFPRGHVSVGTVHHIAWRVADAAAQLALRQRVVKLGLSPTPVIDRKYFTSVYFREPGGVLFEIATDPPGFAIDEAPDHLGESLVLPPHLEAYREQLVATLPPVHLP